MESDAPLTDGPGGHLLGKIPENLLGGVQASPQRVASNIRGFLASKFSGALPDTGNTSLLIFASSLNTQIVSKRLDLKR